MVQGSTSCHFTGNSLRCVAFDLISHWNRFDPAVATTDRAMVPRSTGDSGFWNGSRTAEV